MDKGCLRYMVSEKYFYAKFALLLCNAVKWRVFFITLLFDVCAKMKRMRICMVIKKCYIKNYLICTIPKRAWHGSLGFIMQQFAMQQITFINFDAKFAWLLIYSKWIVKTMYCIWMKQRINTEGGWENTLLSHLLRFCGTAENTIGWRLQQRCFVKRT